MNLGLTLVPVSESVAHEIVGNRFFPATLGIDDPGVSDELARPQTAHRHENSPHLLSSERIEAANGRQVHVNCGGARAWA